LILRKTAEKTSVNDKNRPPDLGYASID
jgi:hypothetical protein